MVSHLAFYSFYKPGISNWPAAAGPLASVQAAVAAHGFRQKQRRMKPRHLPPPAKPSFRNTLAQRLDLKHRPRTPLVRVKHSFA